MDREQALAVVRESLTRAVPGADSRGLAEDAVLRDELELDSLDFLNFVETLSGETGVTIDEEDYERLDTLGACAEFVAARSGSAS
ncbi:acyl carrier protein [Catenulispora subtropica]|uniref:Carrier domain-containing protein n=1 Tax=Catenulispora subtropica TaxID=450798 RepID=A0ABP5EVJ3_9ACTN